MISIVGPEYSQNFSSLIVDPYKKKMLITNISTFIEKTGSDGIDIFWKWPKESEKVAFSSFFKELRNEMKLQQKQYLISVIVPLVDIEYWETGFDFNEILKYVDFMNVHSMDYYDTLDPAPKKAGQTIEKTAKGILKSSPEKRVIGFYSGNECTEITTDQLQQLTHVVFAYIEMNSDGSLEIKNNHINNRFLDFKNRSKSVSPAMISIGGEESSMSYFDMVLRQLEKSREGEFDGLKVMFSIGGQDNSQYFSTVLADENKKKWVLILEKFLKELKQRMNEENEKYVLSVTVPPAGISRYEDGFDLKEMVKHVDFSNVFTMDYYGPWPNQWGSPVGPTSPLYGGINEKKNFNVNYSMQYYKRETGEPSKLNIVIPFYVRNWKNVLEPVRPELEVYHNTELKNGAVEGNVYMSRWTVEHEKVNLSNIKWDEQTKCSYIYDPKEKEYLSLETERSIAAKCKRYGVRRSLNLEC